MCVLCFHKTPRKIVGQRLEDEYMVCGQVSILASCCPQLLSNSVPLLVNKHIIFIPLYFADGFMTEIFYLYYRWIGSHRESLGWQTVYILPHLLPAFEMYCFQSDGC